MRDELFSFFISQFGEATSKSNVPDESATKFQGVLPDQLLQYWKAEGWCGYGNGLFWTVNPDDYANVLDMWLEDTPFEEIDNYHVIARTAFGKLFAWGERTGPSLTISCPIHSLIALEKDLKKPLVNPNHEVSMFFAGTTPDECDLKDESKKPMFERTLAKLGPLQSAEIYRFEPALVAGGRMTVDHLKKVNADIHLTILRQLSPPRIPFGTPRS
jgi:hypothetical protein